MGDQPVRIDDQEIYSFAQLVSYLSSTEANQSISFTVRKGGENGDEMTYQLSPVEKKIGEGSEATTRKLIGFRPKAKSLPLIQIPLS